MMRKLIEMRSKTPPMVPISNPNQHLIGILLAKSKEKEIGWEKFDEESSFYQEPPLKAPIRCESGFLNGGTTKREFCGGGGRVTNHYWRHFRQGEWMTGEGGGRVEPWGSGQGRRMEERLDFHPRYTGETWRDHDNRYTGEEKTYWGSGDPRVRKLKVRMIEDKVKAEERPKILDACTVSAIPYFVFYKDGKTSDILEGANPASMAHKVVKLLKLVIMLNQLHLQALGWLRVLQFLKQSKIWQSKIALRKLKPKILYQLKI
ncbi:hypothetical protein IEQ34_017442 [Dendrobium chrysotoxum]|uniref:Thioredoxin domain-containing protein n=1 Tax=Dendrobium chrysotoxum TaxID=161865 RepID=A0AAV7GBP8_DENCH|nr:hypothetical protein IEQ34_017442 [Dendrobium chrysotoxum]